MLDVSSMLSTLWSKISKPIPNILIGLAVLAFAPIEIGWFGFIFLALGLASAIELGINRYRRNSATRSALYSLNEGEKKVLGKMLAKNEQTISINYNDYHRTMGAAPLGGRFDYVELFGICTGLQTKEILVAASLEEITTFTAHLHAWEIMKKLYRKRPEAFDTVSKG